MISARLVHLLELNWEQVIDRTIAQLHRDPEFRDTRGALERELNEWARDLVPNLGYWLSSDHEQEPALRYEKFGANCYKRDIPLHDAVRGLSTLRRKMMDFAEENLISNSSVELYAEEELTRRLARFFDLLTVHLVQGYEQVANHVHTATH